jgi:TRAP-type C4-dicarboxylate transport system permease small subunit
MGSADMTILEKISQFLTQTLLWMAGCFLGAMVLLVCANIFLRIVWVPISGTFELMGYFGAVVTAFALGYTQLKRGHITVDILILSFPTKVQRALNGVNNVVCMVFFALAAWQITQYATNLWETEEVTETLRIIYYPFTYAVALGCAVLSLVFLVDFLKLIEKKGGDEK